MEALRDLVLDMLYKGITGGLAMGIITTPIILARMYVNNSHRYRVGDDLSNKSLICKTCGNKLSGKFHYCRNCGRTYCADCGIRVCKCGGTVAEAPEEV